MINPVKQLAILGSTGSIGQQTLDVVRGLPGRFNIIALAAGQNIDLLAEQVREFRPEFVYYRDQGEKSLAHLVDVEYGFLSMEDMACHPRVDTVVIATSGRAGLSPMLMAVKAGKNVALANKESLVTAGEVITSEAKLSGARILPVDSEHSAIWQCLNGEKQEAMKIVLTASGGPFRQYSAAQLEKVTAEQALRHPSWQMGKKVTIDSATLMNKGLEVIEAHWLFDTSFDSIEVLIHHQSIIHSMVEFVDGSIKAQLSYPDMHLPIQYALTYPDRLPNPQLSHLNWSNINSLDFAQPSLDIFPCLRLAIEAGKKGGTYPAVLCAADEVAVEFFLSGRIGFVDIARFIERILERHQPIMHPTIEEIEVADIWAREEIVRLINEGKQC
ncbi:1-deoxy-D-xylulose-5-phosphate reductoisomerase [Chloroflexota bacterium]